MTTNYNSLMKYANYIFIFCLCVDQGDGRWKERDKENLRHDILLYKKIAEKLEHEIETFYEEYPEERLSDDNIDTIHHKYLTSLLDRNRPTKETDNEKKHKVKQNFLIVSGKTTAADENSVEKSHELTGVQFVKVNNSHSEFNWPKFEDILLAVGKKYDWKNDRWIKVKDKQKTKINGDVISRKNDKLDFHEKHKFLYKIVKLNRRKSRRNVVVAVSAVR